MSRIGSSELDELRLRGDPPADRVAAAYLDDSAGDFFHGVMRARYHEPGDVGDARLAEWFGERVDLPPWADREQLAKGVEFFELWGMQLGLGLFLSSLPLAYASHDGVQVLALTARLETETKRRVLETAQFVLDVTTPEGLEPGHVGATSIRHVRLMHAGVRHLIDSPHSRVPRSDDPSVWPRWEAAWGTPINQEHLLGTMLSFSSSLLGVLDRLSLDYDSDGADAYCHMWNVIGWLLGVVPDSLPLSRVEMTELEVLIRKRNEQASAAGTEMNEALLELVESYIPWSPVGGVAVSTMRRFIGDDTADLLGVPPADWTRLLVGALTSDDGRFSQLIANQPTARYVTKWLSKRVLRGFVESQRDGGRPPFEVPRRLGGFDPR